MRPGGSRIGEASPYSATWVQTPQGVWLTGRKLDMKSVAVTALGIPKVGLDPSDYSVESLRRTKALHILRGTGDLQTVRALLGHARIESTARYLGLKTKVDPIEVSRAFDI